MMDVLLIVVIGGMGTIYGAVIGSVLFLVAQSYLQDLLRLGSERGEQRRAGAVGACCRPTAGCCGWACCSCCRSTTSPPAWWGACAPGAESGFHHHPRRPTMTSPFPRLHGLALAAVAAPRCWPVAAATTCSTSSPPCIGALQPSTTTAAPTICSPPAWASRRPGLGRAAHLRRPAQPTAAELRRAAIYNNYRALVDMTAAGGYGLLYGPNVAADGT
jgi:hypothetical protein